MKNKIYGYCRISKPTQDIERQSRNIERASPEAIILKETYTGTKVYGREVFNLLLSRVNEGDTIVFDSVSRMSRNADEGIEIYLDLYNKGINLIFLKEPQINTATYKEAMRNQIAMTGDDVDIILTAINSYLIKLATKQIRLAFEQAEKEVKDLHKRTAEGIETARSKGKQIGRAKNANVVMRKAKPIKAIIKTKSKDFYGSNTDKEVIAILDKETIKIKEKNGNYSQVSAHVSRGTYYKYKAEIISELANESKGA